MLVQLRIILVDISKSPAAGACCAAVGALGLNNMAAAVAELETSQLDLLAADFAAIYLNNRYSLPPY